MSDPVKSDGELDGWKEIAAYLKLGIRTAQQYEKQRELPIHRQIDQDKSRVLAYTHELDQWKERRRAVTWKPQSSTSALGDLRVEGAAGSPAVLPENKEPGLFPTRLFLGLALLALIIAGTALYWVLTPHGPMADFQVQGRNLIVLNGKLQELWIHPFDTDLVRDEYQGESKTRRNWLGDLDGSGQQRLLFTWAPSNNAAVGSRLICFGPDNSIKWQFTPGRPVTDAGGDHMVPPYHVAHILVMKGRTPIENRVIVSSAHYLKQPDQVAILDTNGRILGEYWHPGHLLHLEQVDLDGDGRNELLLAGVSNGEHRAVLIVLNPWDISGQVTPVQMQDQGFRLVGMAEAHEKAFVLFPRSCISKGKPYTRATNLYVTADRVVVPVAEGTADVNPGFVYELDYGLRTLKVVPTGDEVRIAHQELEARGEVDHPYSREDLERLKTGVIVRSGRTEK